MNKKTIITFSFLLTCMFVFAQDKDKHEMMEKKLKAKKIAYISDNLDLSPEEAQSFWPLYNAFNEKMEGFKRNEDVEKMSAEASLDKLLADEEQKLQIKKEYSEKFKISIGAEKTLKFFTLDKGFKKRMIKGLERRSKERHKRMEKGRMGGN